MNLREIAQNIVDATMEVIDNRNINIMDCQGFIIASGEQSRINTYHKGAADVIKSNKTIEIYPDQVKDYPGAKEGVNMPITVLGKRVGVVGVYGHPDEVRIVAKLVKRSVELTLEQHLISEQVKLVKDLKQQIIRKLIYGHPEKNKDEILCLCKIIGIDITKKRCAIILELVETAVEHSLKLLKAINKIEAFLIDHNYMDKQDFSAIINKHYIIFKQIPAIGNKQQILKQISQDIYKSCGYKVKIAMGSFHQGIAGYQKSYLEAKALLKIGDMPIKNIADLNMQVEYLLRQINNQQLEHFIGDIYNRIASDKGNIKLWLINTLKALFENNLNVAKAANSLYIHKNTLLYRIKRIEQMTGLSVTNNFDHAILLKLLVIYAERLKKV